MKSLEELRAIREKMQGQIGLRSENDDTTKIVVGMATCGIAAGARPVLKKLVDTVNERGLKNVVVEQTGCIGMCVYEPIVEVFAPGKDKVTYVLMDADKAVKVIDKHIIGGEVVGEYTLRNTDI
ncbi:MAG: (2Fe-2S) ferredoxin domain-containing protein [Mogibacterium sp.]|nr:(2Fe-2S) ferredoxin domain-containing protein [Mogibacterium sp.]